MHAMTEDTKQTDFSFSEQFEPDVFWEQHSRQIMGGFFVVVVVGLVIFYWQHRISQQADEAAQRLAAAHDVKALESIIRDYPGRAVAGQAQLRLADLEFRDGRYAEAGQQYRTFLEQFPKDPLTPNAQLGLAAVQEALGDLQTARQQYERLTAPSGDNYSVALAKLGAARCAEAMGQLKEARQMYEELMALTQGTPLQTPAYLRWSILGRELPATTMPAVVSQPLPTAQP